MQDQKRNTWYSVHLCIVIEYEQKIAEKMALQGMYEVWLLLTQQV